MSRSEKIRKSGSLSDFSKLVAKGESSELDSCLHISNEKSENIPSEFQEQISRFANAHLL